MVECVLISSDASKRFNDWKSISDRVITVRFKNNILTHPYILQVFVPTEKASPTGKVPFYTNLEKIAEM